MSTKYAKFLLGWMAFCLGLGFLLLALSAEGQVIYPPASQAEVNAGTNPSKFVSPATLGAAYGKAGSTLTNSTEWLLFTNLTAYHAGSWYSFAGSTTAGLGEIQGLSPRTTTNASGITIRLADSGEYRFSTPILFTNNVTIRGGGMWSTGLRYVGPTNLWTVNDVQNAFNGTDGYGSQSATNTNFQKVSLFCVMQSSLPFTVWATSQAWPNATLEDFYIISQTNFPAFEIGFRGASLFMNRVAMLGPDCMSSNTIGSMMLQLLPAMMTTPQSLMGGVFNASVNTVVQDCFCDELANGMLDLGNSYSAYKRCQLFNCGYWSGGAGNVYAATNLLWMGAAMYIGLSSYQCTVDSMTASDNGIDLVSLGEPQIYNLAGTQGSKHCLATISTSTQQGTFAGINVNLANDFVLITNAAGTFGIDTNNTDIGNQLAAAAVGAPMRVTFGSSLGGAAIESIYDGPTLAMQFNSAYAGGAGNLAIGAGYALSANGSGMTNLNANLKNMIPAGLNMIVTNMWTPTVTNRLYFTNGILVKFTSP